MEEENQNGYEIQLELTVNPVEKYKSYEYYEELAKRIYIDYIIEGNKVKVFKKDGSIEYVTLEEYIDGIYKYTLDVMVFKSYWNIRKEEDFEGRFLMIAMIIFLILSTYAVLNTDNNIWMIPAFGFMISFIKEFLIIKDYTDILLLGQDLSEDVRIQHFSKSIVEVTS